MSTRENSQTHSDGERSAHGVHWMVRNSIPDLFSPGTWVSVVEDNEELFSAVTVHESYDRSEAKRRRVARAMSAPACSGLVREEPRRTVCAIFEAQDNLQCEFAGPQTAATI